MDFGPTWGVSVYPDTTLRAQLETIEDALAAGHLTLSTAVVRAACWRTAWLVCDPLFGEVEKGVTWRQLAMQALVRASRLLGATTLVVRGGSADYELVP